MKTVERSDERILSSDIFEVERERAERDFVGRVLPGVHQRHGDGAQAVDLRTINHIGTMQAFFCSRIPSLQNDLRNDLARTTFTTLAHATVNGFGIKSDDRTAMIWLQSV